MDSEDSQQHGLKRKQHPDTSSEDKRLCFHDSEHLDNKPFHSTPVKILSARSLLPKNSPVLKDGHICVHSHHVEAVEPNEESRLCEDCGLYTEIDHVQTSLLCDRSHNHGALCPNCGTLVDASVLSACSVHSHGDLDTGYVCHKCGFQKLEESFGCVSDEDKHFLQLYKSSVEKLTDHGKPNIIFELMKLINEDKLDLNSLTFEIFMDTVKALRSNSLTEVRFSHKSKTFWKFFIEKFGGAAVRALTGWKMTGTVLSGKADPGHFSGCEADMIFAIPSEDILKSFDPYGGNWPRQIPPGICEEVIERVHNKHFQTSVCMAFDGKKLAPGVKGNKGDVNLLGREPDGLTVEDKHHIHKDNMATITRLMESAVTLTANKDTDTLSKGITEALSLLARKKNELEEVIKKKTYSLEKLKLRGGEDYTKSRFSYAISMMTALLLELKDIVKRNNTTRDSLSEVGAYLHGYPWPRNARISILNCQSYEPMDMIDVDRRDNSELKQGTDEWFVARKQASATGSKLYEAVGCAGLKAQKEYYLERKGKDATPFSEATLTAIEHGKKHEICGLATYVTKILPVYFPESKVREVGGISLNTDELSLIISPDGLLYRTDNSQHQAALEIKCPFSAGLHTQVPERYYLQIQAEMAALHVRQCHFISWTEETTRVFTVQQDLDVWNSSLTLLSSSFGKSVKKCPSRLTDDVKSLKKKIKEGIEKKCSILCEVSSLHACDTTELSSENRTSQQSLVTTESVLELAEESSLLLRKQFQATRQKATEVVTFVVGDMDRLWSKDQVHGVPVGYFLRGYSLPVQVVGNILEDFLQYCHQKGIHVPVSCFDGQFMKLVQVSNQGHAQTLMELQKQFWTTVTKMSKAKIISELKQCNMNSVMTSVVTSSSGKEIAATSSFGKLPQTAVRQVLFTDPRSKINQSTGENVNDNVDGEIAQAVQDIPLEMISVEETETNDGTDFQIERGLNEENEANYDEAPTVAEEGDRVLSEDEGDPLLPGDDSFLSLSDDDMGDLRQELSSVSRTWASMPIPEMTERIKNCDSVSKLSAKELGTMLKYLRDFKHLKVKVSGTKTKLIEQLREAMNLPGSVPVPKLRKKTAATLRSLAVHALQLKSYPKMALNVTFANWKFPEKVEEWITRSRIRHRMKINGLCDSVSWFYVPEWQENRQQLEVKKIDPHHLLTRHRSALCKGNIGSARRSDFIKVAETGKTQLKPGMMEDRLNMQSTDYSLITFSAEVEAELRANGAMASANLCERFSFVNIFEATTGSMKLEPGMYVPTNEDT